MQFWHPQSKSGVGRPNRTGQGEKSWAFTAPEWPNTSTWIYSNNVPAHFLLFSTLCKAIVKYLGKNKAKSNLEKNMYVWTYVCMHMYLYVYVLYSGIYLQAHTNIYFQCKWNPDCRHPRSPLDASEDPHGWLLCQPTACCHSLSMCWMKDVVHCSLDLECKLVRNAEGGLQQPFVAGVVTLPWRWWAHLFPAELLLFKPSLSPIWKQLPGGKMIQSDIWVPLGMCTVIPFLPSCN